jgi:hypothetical protein
MGADRPRNDAFDLASWFCQAGRVNCHRSIPGPFTRLTRRSLVCSFPERRWGSPGTHTTERQLCQPHGRRMGPSAPRPLIARPLATTHHGTES